MKHPARTSDPSMAMLHGSKIAGMNADQVYGVPTWKDVYMVS